MFLRHLSKLTPTLEGLLPQANRVCVSRFCHATGVKETEENESVDLSNQLSISLNSQTADGIISTLESNKDSMNGSHMVTVIDNFSKWYKQHHGSEQGKHRLKEVIPILIQCTGKLSGQQAVDIIKILDELGVQKQSEVYTVLLQHILSSVNNLSLRNFCDISNIIEDKSIDHSLRQNFKAALETEFLVKLQADLEEYDIESIQYGLNFIAQNPQFTDKKTDLAQMFWRRLCKRDDIIPLDIALSMYASLLSMNYSGLKVNALHKVQNDLAEQAHLLTFDQVTQLLTLMHEAWKRDKLGSYYNEKFANALVRRVIDGELGPKYAMIVLQELQKLRHKSPELLEYCCNNIFGIRAADKRNTLIVPLLTELAVARHKSIFWDEIQSYVSKPIKDKKPDDLVYIASHLIILDWITNPIIKRIFNDSYKLSSVRATCRLFRRIYQRLKLDPLYSGPLPTASQLNDLTILMQESHAERRARELPLLIHLEEGIKDLSCIRTDVKTRLFHELDYVVAFHQDGTPAPISTNPTFANKSSGIIYIEDFTVPLGAKLVIIQLLSQFWFFRNTNELRGYYKLIVDALQLLPYTIVFVNESTWNELPVSKRTSFIMNEIKAKLESAQKVEET